MSKAVFLPVSIGGGLLAGLITKKLFALIWGCIDPSSTPTSRPPSSKSAAPLRPSNPRLTNTPKTRASSPPHKVRAILRSLLHCVHLIADARPASRPPPRRSSSPMTAAVPGDELIPDAPVVMDRRASLRAAPEQVWPWLLQLGKGRAGWYLSRRLERFTPRRHRALRVIEPAYQQVSVGDRVSDYGANGWFEARVVDPPHALVWWSQRGEDLSLTWALVLEPSGPEASELRVRLRTSRRIGRRAPILVERGAELFDRFTIRMMIAGLRERLAQT